MKKYQCQEPIYNFWVNSACANEWGSFACCVVLVIFASVTILNLEHKWIGKK